MKSIASLASLDGKFKNSSGHKTAIQTLCNDFNPLEISELTGKANPESISSYSRNPLDKQQKMSNKLASFTVNNKSGTTKRYWHVELDHESSMLCTFTTPFSRYRFKCLPFGMVVSQDIFQLKLGHICKNILKLLG